MDNEKNYRQCLNHSQRVIDLKSGNSRPIPTDYALAYSAERIDELKGEVERLNKENEILDVAVMSHAAETIKALAENKRLANFNLEYREENRRLRKLVAALFTMAEFCTSEHLNEDFDSIAPLAEGEKIYKALQGKEGKW